LTPPPQAIGTPLPHGLAVAFQMILCIANTTATISLQNSNAQILVRYAAAQGIQPPDYIYTKF
jgi:hypothetical protein